MTKTIDRQRIAELTEKEEQRLEDLDAQVVCNVQARREIHADGRRLHLPRPRPLPRLLHPRQGFQDLFGGRPGDQRLPQRLRLHGAGSRPSRHRRGHSEARPARHAVRPAHRRRHHHGRAPGRRFQAAEVALRQLGLRSHYGRHPRRPRLHRPRDHRQDVRLLSRAPRLRHGLHRRRRLRQDRPPRQLCLAALRRWHPAVLDRPDHPGGVQRRAPT